MLSLTESSLAAFQQKVLVFGVGQIDFIGKLGWTCIVGGDTSSGFTNTMECFDADWDIHSGGFSANLTRTPVQVTSL